MFSLVIGQGYNHPPRKMVVYNIYL